MISNPNKPAEWSPIHTPKAYEAIKLALTQHKDQMIQTTLYQILAALEEDCEYIHYEEIEGYPE